MPLGLTATEAVAAVEIASATMSPAFTTVSLPVAATFVFSYTTCARSRLASNSTRVVSILPLSASIPVAVAVACVPPSQAELPATARPFPVTVTLASAAVAIARDVRPPSFSIQSSPLPDSIPPACASTSARPSVSAWPLPVTPTSAASVVAMPVDVMAPVLSIVSPASPLT